MVVRRSSASICIHPPPAQRRTDLHPRTITLHLEHSANGPSPCPSARLTRRLYAGSPYVEFEWTVGLGAADSTLHACRPCTLSARHPAKLAPISPHPWRLFQVGPIPHEDGLGREVVVQYVSNVESGDTFWTDANGREMIRRVRWVGGSHAPSAPC